MTRAVVRLQVLRIVCGGREVALHGSRGELGSRNEAPVVSADGW